MSSCVGSRGRKFSLLNSLGASWERIVMTRHQKKRDPRARLQVKRGINEIQTIRNKS